MKVRQLVLAVSLFTLTHCGTEISTPLSPEPVNEPGPVTIPTGPVKGTLAKKAWNMTGGEARNIETSKGKELYIVLWDSPSRKPCQFFGAPEKFYEVSIRVKPQVGETKVGPFTEGAAFVAFQTIEPGKTHADIATSGRMILDSTSGTVKGKFHASTNDNSAGGEFSVPLCP